jgi:acyl dehydratase
MKLPAGHVGTTVGPLVQEIDARWLMAYAASLGDMMPEYLDTTRPQGVTSHPLFPVCYEWPLAVELRDAMPQAIAVRSVHATHDLRLHRRVRPGDRLSTTATVISTEPRAPGAYVVTRFQTTDAVGRHVSTTDYGSIYRGVECERAGVPAGPDESRSVSTSAAAAQEASSGRPEWSVAVAVPAGLAHTYTECARIWNPIHTDKAVAHSAGLPDIILHGTATLALAVSAVLEHARAGAAANVTHIRCRFTGMVLLSSTLTVGGWDEPDRAGRQVIAFQALDADGHPALRNGRLVVGGLEDVAETPP